MWIGQRILHIYIITDLNEKQNDISSHYFDMDIPEFTGYRIYIANNTSQMVAFLFRRMNDSSSLPYPYVPEGNTLLAFLQRTPASATQVLKFKIYQFETPLLCVHVLFVCMCRYRTVIHSGWTKQTSTVCTSMATLALTNLSVWLPGLTREW